MSEPDRIGPDVGPKKTMTDRVHAVKHAFLTRHASLTICFVR